MILNKEKLRVLSSKESENKLLSVSILREYYRTYQKMVTNIVLFHYIVEILFAENHILQNVCYYRHLLSIVYKSRFLDIFYFP